MYVDSARLATFDTSATTNRYVVKLVFKAILYYNSNSMFVFRFALKNVVSRKSSVVIVLFIAFAISLLVLSNAIFDGTDNGVEKAFVNSFTGDVVIRPQVKFPLSLFGDETPLTGELSAIPNLMPYTDVLECVKNTPGIATCIPQLTGLAVARIKNHEVKWLFFFGVDADSYLNAMSATHLVQGRAFSSGERGIMLSEKSFEYIKTRFQMDLQPGDSIQLISTNGTSFTIRSAPFTGVYAYDIPNTMLDNIALADPHTIRGIMNKSESVYDDSTINEEHRSFLGTDDDFFIDDLFSDSSDFIGNEQSEQEAASFSLKALDNGQPSSANESDNSTSWSFIICKSDKTVPTKILIKTLNDQFKKNGWAVQAVNWRNAAGGMVALVYYLRLIFNIGIILILLTGFIVVNNTLVISALDRVYETGTLRAIGANRRFVALQFLFETAILTITAGILGCALGCVLNAVLGAVHVTFTNDYLIQLFGSNTLSTVVTVENIVRCMVLSVLLAIAGWVYPVHIALESNPVVAMRGLV